MNAGMTALRDDQCLATDQKKSSAPGGSQRQLRVGETVRHAVADILSQVRSTTPTSKATSSPFPRCACRRTLKLATIYVMPLGGRDHPMP